MKNLNDVDDSVLSEVVAEAVRGEVGKIVVPGAPRSFYPLKEAGQILGMSRSKMWRLQKDGRLQARKVDKRVYITHDSIIKLVMGDDYKEKAPA